jgi:hypothetical protein
VADDDSAVKAKLAALEAEVKQEAAAARARKEAALAKLRAQQEEQQELRRRQAELVSKKKPEPEPEDEEDEGVGGAIELASRANRVGKELAKKPAKGEKSWIKSGVASLALGPIGWLYAGSLREAIPATAVWIALLGLASKILPTILLWPVLMIVMPLSGIAGVVYALQYNRHGGRQRLFDKERDEKKPKQLRGG